MLPAGLRTPRPLRFSTCVYTCVLPFRCGEVYIKPIGRPRPGLLYFLRSRSIPGTEKARRRVTHGFLGLPGFPPRFVEAGVRGSISAVKLFEAQYEKGLLRPTKPLVVRPGERVGLMRIRRPGPRRWNPDRLRKSVSAEHLELAEQGLVDWSKSLDEEDRSLKRGEASWVGLGSYRPRGQGKALWQAQVQRRRFGNT